MLAGGVLTVALTLWPALRPWAVHAGLYGVILNAALLVGVSWFTAPDPRGEAFVEEAAGRTGPAAATPF